MVYLERDELVFRFPEVHEAAVLRVNFQRTLRIPDDNREYPLPPGLGRFPLKHVDDYAERAPGSWKWHGGVFLPMYQAEALWIAFESEEYRFAVKVAAGKVNAVTGEGWSQELKKGRQDYVVAPEQPWLDGFSVGKGVIRQFVAMPLGAGYTAEEQLTGAGEHGGLQICVYPMKAKVFERWRRPARVYSGLDLVSCSMPSAKEMGLAPGGVMRQEIYDDPHGIGAWETGVSGRCFVHLANSLVYREMTGEAPPSTPATAQEYTEAGLPWFDYYGGDLGVLEGSKALAALDSVAAMGWKKGAGPLGDNGAVEVKKVIGLGKGGGEVREGEF
ncbi:MAG: hypothetical protein KJZ79_12935 [Bryobacteraceae bacterium]|nr:hypothetical protein [Bryobacteraceae bacterium]